MVCGPNDVHLLVVESGRRRMDVLGTVILLLDWYSARLVVAGIGRNPVAEDVRCSSGWCPAASSTTVYTVGKEGTE